MKIEPGSFTDRAVGALVGLAVGDALGTTLEFSERDAHPQLTEMVGGGPFRLPAGVWTDDTSMALCLADSLIANGGLDPADTMHRFVRWWRDGENSPTGRCFDIGISTRAALARFESTGDPLAGDPSPSSAGNGSLMRLAPAALFYIDDEDAAAACAVAQSKTTHGAEECLQACDWFARLIVRAVHGQDDEALWPADGGAPLEGRVAELARGAWRGKDRADIRSSGYVVHTLEAACWAVANATSFEEALVLAVNLADDADTVGAVTGQLAGAKWGASAIPGRWLEPLAWRPQLEAMACELLRRGAAARGLEAFLNAEMTRGGWEADVAAGRWDRIPAGLSYEESGGLAHLLNGYSMAERLALDSAAAVSEFQRRRYAASGRWEGSAVELWTTLFFAHRADRFTVMLAADPPRPEMDALCRSLREALLSGRFWPEWEQAGGGKFAR